MRHLKTLLLAILSITLLGCTQEDPLLFHIGFEGFPVGPFKNVVSDSGTWNAEEEVAQIIENHRVGGEKMLRFAGGAEKAIEWTLPQIADNVHQLAFQAFSFGPPDASFLVVEKFAEGQWQELQKIAFTEDRKIGDSFFIKNKGPVEKIRLVSTTPESTGMLLDNIDLLSAAPMRLVSVMPHSPVFPALTSKDNNPVLEIRVRINGTEKPLELNSIGLSLEGSTRLEDIRKARIFYSGTSFIFSEDQPVGDAMQPAHQLHLSGNQILQHGVNYFWVALSLQDDVDRSHQIQVRCTEVIIDDKKLTVTSTSPAPPKRIGHALRQHNDEGVHTYRIPGLVTTRQETLIAVYDIRRNSSTDLQGDIDIGMSRSTDKGKTWEPMKVIMDMGEWGNKPQDQNGIGDPAVLVDRQTNTIWVAAIWAHGQPGTRNWVESKPGLSPEKTSQLILTKSEDEGITWSEPINLTSQLKNPNWYLLLQGPGKGITMEDGTLVFPAQYKDENQMPHATILYSQDHGKTWQLGASAKSNTTEAQVVELSDGSLMLNMRDNRGSGPGGRNGDGARSVAITKDLGKTWTEHPTSRKALPEPVCNASLIRHTYQENGQEKQILLFVNPDHRYVRRNMTIKVSFDEGMTWPEEYHTLLDEGIGRGYPSMTSIDENTIGILYEGSQADLVFQKISLAELLRR